MTEVSGLYIYPIKGARPMSLASVDVDPTGLKGDRQFAVFKDGARCNVKQIPAIQLIVPEWQESTLNLSYPAKEGFSLDTTIEAGTQVEEFRGGQTPVVDMGDPVASWLSDALKTPVRLCRIAEPTPFIIPLPEFTEVHGRDQQRFVDAAPVMLANSSSLDDLNQRLASPVEMGRFRPNIVLSDMPAYAEDERDTFRFDEVELCQVAPCERCKVVTMDLVTGETGKEPLKTLASYRKRESDYAGGVMFGTYLAVGASGRLSVGDRLL